MAVEVVNYKNTGLRYIRGTNKTLVGFSNNNGVAVNNTDFDAWDTADILMAQVLGLASNPAHSGYDFDYTVRTGVLSDQHRGARTPQAPVPSAPPPLTNPSVAKAVGEEPKEALPETETAEVDFSVYNKTVESLSADGLLHNRTSEEPSNLVRVEIVNLDGTISSTLVEEPVAETPKLTIVQNILAFLRGDRTGKQKEKTVHKVSIHNSVIIMLTVIIIVGLGSMAMSGYHIYAYMFDGGRPQPVALVTGVIMTLFSAIAFTSARYFGNGKKISDKLIGVAFSLFGVIVVAFAMFSTTKVNYDQFKAGTDTKTIVKVEVATAVKAVYSKTAFATSELARIDADIAKQTRDAASAKYKWQEQVNLGKDGDADLKWQYWSNKTKAEKQILADQDERKPYASAVLGAGEAVVKAEEKVKQEAGDGTIFGLLHRLFGIDQETILFIVYVIPAIFYDLMCPFALTVGMMLYDRIDEPRKEDKE